MQLCDSIDCINVLTNETSVSCEKEAVDLSQCDMCGQLSRTRRLRVNLVKNRESTISQRCRVMDGLFIYSVILKSYVWHVLVLSA
jgi:hypothetical protein